MILVGGVNLLLRRGRWYLRTAATLLMAGLALTGVWALAESSRAIGLTASIVGVTVAACWTAESRRLAAVLSLITSWTRPPAARWGLMALAGLGIAVASVVHYEVREEEAISQSMADLEFLSGPPPSRTPERVRATTDRGTLVPLMETAEARSEQQLRAYEEKVLQSEVCRNTIIRRQPVDDRSNCHGWVFTAGQFWITGRVVDLILNENGYQPVTEPQPGDLAVYRDHDNSAVLHTALVRYVTAGMPVLVEGKWGATGVYLHPADKSIYGSKPSYYRSPRPGHLLVGLGGPSAGPGGAQFSQAR